MMNRDKRNKPVRGGQGRSPDTLERDGNAIAGAALCIVVLILFSLLCIGVNWLHESAVVLL